MPQELTTTRLVARRPVHHGGAAAQQRRDDAARQLAAAERRVARSCVACSSGTTTRRMPGSTSTRLAGSPTAIGRPWSLTRPMRRGRRGQHAGDVGPGQPAGVDHRLLHDGQRGLQAGHAERGRAPLAVLVLARVRRVVGGDDVDRAVGQALADRLDVALRAQRRVDLEHRVVAAGQLVGEDQVVRRDLGGHVDPAGLGPADDLDRAGRRQVADVQPRADVLGEQHVARDDRLLRDRGPARPGRARRRRRPRASGRPRSAAAPARAAR